LFLRQSISTPSIRSSLTLMTEMGLAFRTNSYDVIELELNM